MPREPLPSKNAIDLHKRALVEVAIRLAAEDPGRRLVAVVAEPDAPIIDMIRAWPGNKLQGEDGSVATFTSRESARQMLLQANPAFLEVLEDEGEGPRRTLPVIYWTNQGLSLSAIEYDATA